MSSPFARKKSTILQQLDAPAEEYSDASPKGSVDEGIRELIQEINDIPGLVTTSSCAGRVSIFLDGNRGTGGKGGGCWLYISHSPVALANENVLSTFGFDKQNDQQVPNPNRNRSFIHFKFEAMVHTSPTYFSFLLIQI